MMMGRLLAPCIETYFSKACSISSTGVRWLQELQEAPPSSKPKKAKAVVSHQNRSIGGRSPSWSRGPVVVGWHYRVIDKLQ